MESGGEDYIWRVVYLTEVLTITDLMFSNADNISALLVAVALIIAVIIGITEYKSKLWEYITNRRNKWWFAYAAVMFAAILFFRGRSWLTGCRLIGVSTLWVLYVAACYFSLKPKQFTDCADPILKRYAKKLGDGRSIEYIYFFRKPHWYFWTAEDKLEYQMLSVSYFADVKEFSNAYQALEKIKDKWLYEEEKETIKLQRAMLLTQMGSMKAAYQILGDPDKNESGDPMVWFAYSFIFENAGDIDKALIYAEKSRDIVESGYKAPDFVTAEIYNNYSRVAIFKGNRPEALRYLNIAWNKVKGSKDMRTVHIIASNRIAQMAMAGKSRAECEAALKEYKDLIPNDSFMNKVDYNNCEIGYYRQIKDSKRENELIKSGFKDVIDYLDPTQRTVYISSTFCMLMNGHFDRKWFDEYVRSDSKEYDELPLMDKLAVFKNYIGFFQQEEFRAICNREPYLDLQKKIMKYYREQAIADIDGMLAVIAPNDRFRYMNLMTMKLGILKLVEGKSHIDRSKDSYVALYRELYDAGLHLDAIRVLTILVDECTSPYSILILGPFWIGAMYYSDILEKAAPPDPTLDPDGIHLQYPRLHLAPPFEVQPLHIDVIEEYIDTIIGEFRSWKNHPFKVELSIEIAHILMCLDRKEDAKEFLQFFKNSGVSESQMSSWARDEITALEADLPHDTGMSIRPED